MSLFWSHNFHGRCTSRFAGQHGSPQLTSVGREHAADEETDGAGDEGRQIQIQQQQREGLRVHAHAVVRHWGRSVCGIQVFEGKPKFATPVE